MGARDDTRRRIIALARRQHGVLTYRQLLECGLTRRQIAVRVARGELYPLFHGVYALGPIVTARGRELGAVLACGPCAILSHRSAAALHAILRRPAGALPIDVTVTGPHRGRHPGIRLHRHAQLAADERAQRFEIAVTAPTRTLLDLAAVAVGDELEAAVAEAFAIGISTRADLLGAMAAARGRRGVARLRALLDGGGQPARTRSIPERRLLTLIRDAALPEPEVNVRVGRWEVDFLWRDRDLVVEVDGYSTHSSPRAFERDHRKDAELADLGLTVRRVSARQIRDDPYQTVSRLRRALRRARSTPAE